MCCLTALSSRTASAAQGHAQSQVAAAHVLHLDATALARMLSPRQVPSSVAAPQRRRVQRNKLLNDGNVAGVIQRCCCPLQDHCDMQDRFHLDRVLFPLSRH